MRKPKKPAPATTPHPKALSLPPLTPGAKEILAMLRKETTDAVRLVCDLETGEPFVLREHGTGHFKRYEWIFRGLPIKLGERGGQE